jgi:hypothetical protein
VVIVVIASLCSGGSGGSGCDGYCHSYVRSVVVRYPCAVAELLLLSSTTCTAVSTAVAFFGWLSLLLRGEGGVQFPFRRRAVSAFCSHHGFSRSASPKQSIFFSTQDNPDFFRCTAIRLAQFCEFSLDADASGTHAYHTQQRPSCGAPSPRGNSGAPPPKRKCFKFHCWTCALGLGRKVTKIHQTYKQKAGEDN